MRADRSARWGLRAVVAAAVVVLGAGPARAGELRLAGGGATFALSLYTRWFAEYGKKHADVVVDYQPVGSATGTRSFFEEKLDFAGTDVPIPDGDLGKSGVKSIHLPMTMGAVVPIYNLPLPGLRLSGEVLALIFLGSVTRWDDPLLIADNPGVKLPQRPITVVRRSDSSGITYVWTDFLSKVSPDWKEKVGTTSAPAAWPAGRGAMSNEGVAQLVKSTPGAIGYVELTHALRNKLSYAAVKNPLGEYVKADYTTLTAAAAAVRVPSDYRVSITNAKGKRAYPIGFYTFLLVNLFMPDAQKSAALRGLLTWVVTEGQGLSEGLGFARLPQDVARREVLDIASLK